ncbi:MAG: RHS repeat protein, partial [Candidatus Eisenbacteria sp.]|nr:RHS repeat protein [Candidatus Eisenbacteria bacterium]
ASSGTLSLLDLPLKVRTHKMVLRNGVLEDDSSGESSKGALDFVEWFTNHFDEIAEEQYLQPPPKTGLTEPVPIYAELRRVALITAVAEQLRDQGVPMPFWMRDYEVKPIPIPATTPAMTIEKTRESGSRTTTASLYGGVSLSPADDVVNSFQTTIDTLDLPEARREAHTEALAQADALAPAVAEAMEEQPPLTPFAVNTTNRRLMAVAFPGAESVALAPCRLEEVDLVVTGEGGVRLSLVRYFNSYFQPTGELGTGWTLDLPRLEQTSVPKNRTDFGSESVAVLELLTPLNTQHARFSAEAEVPQLEARLLIPDRSCDVLAMASVSSQLVPEAETKIIFRDGRCWLFDDAGCFLAEEAKPLTTVYHRDKTGRVARISGYHGGRETAALILEYDSYGRLSAAGPVAVGQEECCPHPKQPRSRFSRFLGRRRREERTEPRQELTGGVTYRYDENGMLRSITSPDSDLTYTYKDGLVTDICRVPSGSIDAQTTGAVRRFEYAPNGQLTSEITPNGTRVSYDVEQQEGQRQVRIGAPGSCVLADYDLANRPVALRRPDGTRTTWRYGADGAVAAETVFPWGDSHQMTLSAGGKQRTVSPSAGGVIYEELDDAGRVTKLSIKNALPAGAQDHGTAT